MRVSLINSIKFGASLKEVRIHLSQKDAASKGVRDFISSQYVAIKKDNPKLPILIRECEGVQPRIWARYECRQEKSIPLTNLSATDVQKSLEALAK